jgi:hypothetical protein
MANNVLLVVEHQVRAVSRIFVGVTLFAALADFARRASKWNHPNSWHWSNPYLFVDYHQGLLNALRPAL